MNTSAPPQLAPPGAGLPLVQLLFLKLWLGPFVSKRASLSQVRTDYERGAAKFIEKAEAVPAQARKVKVLVRPLPGIEDSSRYWSVDETLEHVMIVARKAEQIILALAAGNIPEEKADVAKVKPKGGLDDALAEFRAFAPGLLQRLDEQLARPGMDIESRREFDHPWFGGFRARQWYWLLPGHQSVHYRQLKEIIRGLTK